jgi:small subunit ribosomal protein S18
MKLNKTKSKRSRSNKSRFRNSKLDLSMIKTLDYKNTEYLRNFISPQGKILPRRRTKLNSKQQKRITKLIKRARVAAVLEFVIGKVR